MPKRKQTLLQLWRSDYADLSFTIRAAKQARKKDGGWGQYKQPQAQSYAARLRVDAREMMESRALAAAFTAEQWEHDRLKREATKAQAGIPNTVDPALKV